MKTIQRREKRSRGMCAKRPERGIGRWPDAEERAGDGERVRDPRTVRFEELNAGESGGSECFGEREWKPEELEKD